MALAGNPSGNGAGASTLTVSPPDPGPLHANALSPLDVSWCPSLQHVCVSLGYGAPAPSSDDTAEGRESIEEGGGAEQNENDQQKPAAILQKLMRRITSGHYARMQRGLGFHERDAWVRAQPSVMAGPEGGLTFARLMLQPAALGASRAGMSLFALNCLPSTVCPQLKLGASRYTDSRDAGEAAEEEEGEGGVVSALGGHGSLWFGNYGEHYSFHKYETVQVIFVAASDVSSLVMLSESERTRVEQVCTVCPQLFALNCTVGPQLCSVN